jgi:hypothetical protein
MRSPCVIEAIGGVRRRRHTTVDAIPDWCDDLAATAWRIGFAYPVSRWRTRSAFIHTRLSFWL